MRRQDHSRYDEAMQQHRRLRLILILLGLLLIGATPWAVWSLQPHSSLKMLIVDKSVPDLRYREHSALVWALNHLKLKGPSGGEWQMEHDYLGYQPADPTRQTRERKETVTPSALAPQQALFLADTYGVYRQDQAEASGNSPDYSPRIYGGLEQAEVNAITAFAQRGGHIIGEFNTFASPTRGTARQDLEKLFGLSWTGWTGRFFDALETPAKFRPGHGVTGNNKPEQSGLLRGLAGFWSMTMAVLWCCVKMKKLPHQVYTWSSKQRILCSRAHVGRCPFIFGLTLSRPRPAALFWANMPCV